MKDMIAPITPGEILSEEFLKPLGISQEKLSRDLDIAKTRISAIVRGNRAITVDTAIRLSVYFGNSAEFWLNLQQKYDLARSENRRDEIAASVRKLEVA